MIRAAENVFVDHPITSFVTMGILCGSVVVVASAFVLPAIPLIGAVALSILLGCTKIWLEKNNTQRHLQYFDALLATVNDNLSKLKPLLSQLEPFENIGFCKEKKARWQTIVDERSSQLTTLKEKHLTQFTTDYKQDFISLKAANQELQEILKHLPEYIKKCGFHHEFVEKNKNFFQETLTSIQSNRQQIENLQKASAKSKDEAAVTELNRLLTQIEGEVNYAIHGGDDNSECLLNFTQVSAHWNWSQLLDIVSTQINSLQTMSPINEK